jgi:hypothetical protein
MNTGPFSRVRLSLGLSMAGTGFLAGPALHYAQLRVVGVAQAPPSIIREGSLGADPAT